MSLKFKRNLPLILLIVSVLTFLALTFGNLPIVAFGA